MAASIDLDLGALAGPLLHIKDTRGRVWEVSESPPLLTMVKLFSLAQGGAKRDGESITPAEITQIVDGVTSIFQMTDPTVTADEVAGSFTLDGLLTVIAFLFSGDEGREILRSSANPAAEAAPEAPAAGPTPTTTPTPRRSKKSSAAAS